MADPDFDPSRAPARNQPPQRPHLRPAKRPGLTAARARLLGYVMYLVVAIFGVGWVVAIASADTPEESAALRATAVSSPLGPDAPPPNAYLMDAAITKIAASSGFTGESKQLRVLVRAPGDTLAIPDSLASSVTYAPSSGSGPSGTNPNGNGAIARPDAPGIWNMLVRVREGLRTVPDLKVITLVPLSEKKNGRIGSYLVGSWPYENGARPRSPAYAPPRGLVRVMPQDLAIQVSEHFKLGDFVTKGQNNVWPKYVAMSPRLLDKLELTIDELEKSGTPVQHIGIISGFRTPSYNENGGDPTGRAALSRHMYGDAMDWYIDNDHNGRMDDLNHDGRFNKNDAAVIRAAAEKVERAHPNLVGGVGLYNPTGAHGGFVHIDTRGYRARW
jgi:uncharacterized protein YcbK (DUF882 family)